MIEIMEVPKKAENDDSVGAFYEKYNTAAAKSYEKYIEYGHHWCWCLVGNIVQEHAYGEKREIKYGTKHFSRGTKVYLAPVQWGDGYEYIVVIGLPRYGNKYIEVIMRSAYIENYRMKKVYKPAVLKRICSSPYYWWGDTENDRKEIIQYLKTRAPEEAEKEMLKMNSVKLS